MKKGPKFDRPAWYAQMQAYMLAEKAERALIVVADRDGRLIIDSVTRR